MNERDLAGFLNFKADKYNSTDFIKADPVCIPHLFNKQEDIEIAGFFAAIFSWGNRAAIIQKSKQLMQLMNDRPFEFCLHHTKKDLVKLSDFKHRTFNYTDLLYFIEFFKFHYSRSKTLETAFTDHGTAIENMLTGFHHYFFSLNEVPQRTKKHVSTPERKSACKRLNMFLRWMVRKDKKGVDFGIWKNISPAELICPLDLHVARVARKLKLLDRRQSDWVAAVSLTEKLRAFDPHDPVKYDFALFGLGIIEKY